MLQEKQHKEWHNGVNVYASKSRPRRLELGMWKEAVESKTEKQCAKLDLCNLPSK